MTFDEELLVLDERADLSEGEVRKESIKTIKKWLPSLEGRERLIAQNNLAMLYLDTGTDIKERMMNAFEAQPYFLEVWNSEAAPPLRYAAAYHLGHVAILEGNRHEALKWFERALSSNSIDLGRRIKSYFQASKCSFAIHNFKKAKEYLESGRNLDTGRKYQSEYEAAFYLLQLTAQEEQLPFIMHKSGATPVPLSFHEYQQLCSDSNELLLDLGSDHGPRLYYQGYSSKITDPFAEMIKELSTSETAQADDYWLVNLFSNLNKTTSFRNTIYRMIKELSKDGFPELMVRDQNRYRWNAHPLLVIESTWPK